MKYRHSFHAGNFADVHKHVILLALLAGLQRKEKGFLYLDTHAGAGRYDLGSPDTHHGAEAKHGVSVLRSHATFTAPELRDYVTSVASAAAALGGEQLYPGSPVLAAQALRVQDRGACFEILPPECRALERALGGFRRMQIHCEDGLKCFGAWLPPPERRALILIDPPYENAAADLDATLEAVRQIRGRLANAVIAIWYPIKDERLLTSWLARATQQLGAPALISELWVYPRDSRVSLNGSGVLLVNPPYQLDVRMREWLPELSTALDVQHQGGCTQRWIIEEEGQSQ